jgi:hypothetical protein
VEWTIAIQRRSRITRPTHVGLPAAQRRRPRNKGRDVCPKRPREWTSQTMAKTNRTHEEPFFEKEGHGQNNPAPGPLPANVVRRADDIL